MTDVIINHKTRRARKKDLVRSQIVSTAIDLFSRHGIDGVTVDQIAEAADIGKGTIYNYFQAKEDIVVSFMADFERKVQAKLQGVDTSNRTLAEVLIEFIRIQFRMKKRYHAFVRIFFGQMFSHTEQFLPYMAEMQKTIDPPIHDLLSSLQRRGAIRRDVNVAELAFIFKTMHLGLTALWAIEGPPFRTTDRTLTQEIKLLCEGIEAKR